MSPSPSADIDQARLPSCGSTGDGLLLLDPQNHPVDQHAPKSADSPTLEGLPAELRTALLLNMPDLATLSRLVHASPVFHAQYLLDRKSILFKALLEETTEDVFVDVYAAFKSHPSRMGLPRGPNTNVTGFLELYLAWHSPDTRTRPTPDKYSLKDICLIASFQQSTVGPLATHFVSWALANYRSGPAPPSAQPPKGEAALTRMEKIRVMRACYRFEVFCHLCYFHYEIFGVDINESFFSNAGFEPWEAEEMCSIYAFIKEKYDEVVEDVKWDLDETNHKSDDEFEHELEGLAFPIGRMCHESRSGTIGHGGLNLALKMIRAETHDERVALTTNYLRLGGGFLEKAMEFANQVSRQHSHLNDRYRTEESGQAMLFLGDDSGAPPLVWTLLWGGRYSHLFGEYVPDELRRWGYVIWDARRIDFEGTKKYLKDLWASSPALKLICRDWEWIPKYLD